MGQDVTGAISLGQNVVGQDVVGAISLGQEVSGAGGSGKEVGNPNLQFQSTFFQSQLLKISTKLVEVSTNLSGNFH